MSGRKRTQLSPSLFPFLAVLVCTLGTLILLLALVSQNAATAAEVEAQKQLEEQRDTKPRLSAKAANELIDEAQFRVDALVSVRDQQVADIEERRDQLGHLDDHMERLKSELKKLNEQMKIAVGRIESSEIDPQQIVFLEQQIDAENKKLGELRTELREGNSRVVIVPYTGVNGTDRRPVYLECTEKGLTIWPEGILIPESALENSVKGANPLDAALRVVRHHALQNYGDKVSPYPLLVVRPNGIKAYAVARHAMRDWDDQFGYELVSGEKELAFPKADPLLKPRIEQEVREAMRQQSMLRSLHSDLARLGSAGNSIGGEPRRMPTLSAAEMDRKGRASGFRQHRDPYGRRFPHEAAAAAAAGAAGGNQYNTGADAIRQLDSTLRNAAGGFSSADAEAATANSTSQQYTQSAMDAIRGIQGTGGAGGFGDQAGNPDKRSREDQFGDFDPTNDTMRTNPFSNTEQPIGPSTTNQYVASQAGANQGSISQQIPNQNQAATGSGATPTRAGQAPAGQQAQAQQPPNGASSSPANGPPPENLVQRGGEDWALPQNLVGARGTELVRTVRVQCFGDRFVLLPSRGSPATEMFGLMNGNVERATLQLATAVRDRISRWGAALPGGRWQPRLDVEVMPGGQQRFNQLQALMNGSGVEVVGRNLK